MILLRCCYTRRYRFNCRLPPKKSHLYKFWGFLWQVYHYDLRLGFHFPFFLSFYPQKERKWPVFFTLYPYSNTRTDPGSFVFSLLFENGHVSRVNEIVELVLVLVWFFSSQCETIVIFLAKKCDESDEGKLYPKAWTKGEMDPEQGG